MKAAIVPSVNSAWVLREVPTPEPGPNQVLIKIRASGMCYAPERAQSAFFLG